MKSQSALFLATHLAPESPIPNVLSAIHTQPVESNALRDRYQDYDGEVFEVQLQKGQPDIGMLFTISPRDVCRCKIWEF